MSAILFTAARKPYNLHCHCGGIGGTGNRKDAGMWRNSRVPARQITGNDFIMVLSEQTKRIQAKLNGGYTHVQHSTR
jgi:hypothetical protein